jgi:hypothetical protein
MTLASVGGLPGSVIDPGAHGTGGIHPSVGDNAPVSRPSVPPSAYGLADGSLVEGLVSAKDGDIYQVRIGVQMMNARSTIPLFVGQRFRAVWDASVSPPVLRLRQSDMMVLARFMGRDHEVALALLSRGLPVDEESVDVLRRQWMKNGGENSKLGAMTELWARGVEITGHNISLLIWYMGLSPEETARIWKKISRRLRREKFASPKELAASLFDGEDEEVSRFLDAHALAGHPARRGFDPASCLAPSWWPINDDGEPVRARVAFSRERIDERRVWRSTFEFEGRFLGPVRGEVMTNGKALSVNIRLEDESKMASVQNSLPKLRRELDAMSLVLQYLGTGSLARGASKPEERYGLDMEI